MEEKVFKMVEVLNLTLKHYLQNLPNLQKIVIN